MLPNTDKNQEKKKRKKEKASLSPLLSSSFMESLPANCQGLLHISAANSFHPFFTQKLHGSSVKSQLALHFDSCIFFHSTTQYNYICFHLKNLLNGLCCAQSCPTLCDPVDCSLTGSSVHGDSPSKNTGVDCHDLLEGIFPTQGSNPGLMEDSLPSEPLVKPKNTRVGSLSFLQGIFQTQELSQGFLH